MARVMPTVTAKEKEKATAKEKEKEKAMEKEKVLIKLRKNYLYIQTFIDLIN